MQKVVLHSVAGHIGEAGLQAMQAPLDFNTLIPPSQKFARSVADSWDGNMLLLQCMKPFPGECRQLSAQLSMSSQRQAADPMPEAVPHTLQYHRLLGCLQ